METSKSQPMGVVGMPMHRHQFAIERPIWWGEMLPTQEIAPHGVESENHRAKLFGDDLFRVNILSKSCFRRRFIEDGSPLISHLKSVNCASSKSAVIASGVNPT